MPFSIERHVPTLHRWLEKRADARKRRLPPHLRPRPVWPIWVQLVLNIVIAYTLMHLMFNRNEYFTETGPALMLGLCTFLLIFTIIEGLRYRKRYAGKPGARLAKINVWFLAIAFLCLPLAISTFLN